jgi:hypothetical protein
VCCPSGTFSLGIASRQCCKGSPDCCYDAQGDPIRCGPGEICVQGACQAP